MNCQVPIRKSGKLNVTVPDRLCCTKEQSLAVSTVTAYTPLGLVRSPATEAALEVRTGDRIAWAGPPSKPTTCGRH